MKYLFIALLTFSSATFAGGCVWHSYNYVVNGKTVFCHCVVCDGNTSCTCS